MSRIKDSLPPLRDGPIHWLGQSRGRLSLRLASRSLALSLAIGYRLSAISYRLSALGQAILSTHQRSPLPV